nr:helix-turn-helix transcriptional regulator [Micromonospora sp. DSM 115978]
MVEKLPRRGPAPTTPGQTTPGRATPGNPHPWRPDAGPARGEPLWRHVLGDRLRNLRHERGETLTETAARAGVSPQYLSEIERGIKEPSSEMIAAVGGALDVTLAELVTSVADHIRATDRPAAPVTRAAYALAA